MFVETIDQEWGAWPDSLGDEQTLIELASLQGAVPLVKPLSKNEKAVPIDSGAGNPSAIVDIRQIHA